MNMLKIKINSCFFVLFLALFYGFVLNHAVYLKFHQLATISGSSLFSYFSPLLLTSAFIIIFYFFNIPYIRKPFFIILTLISSIASYAIYQYGLIIDYDIIESVFETHSSEALSYFNIKFLIYFIAAGILPSCLIAKVKITRASSCMKQCGLHTLIVLLSLSVIGVTYAFAYKNYASVGRSTPYLHKMIVPVYVNYVGRYIKNTYFSKPLPYTQLGTDAHLSKANQDKPLLAIVVIGETARSMNIGYNGYARNTNPHTQNLDIISLQHVSSCGTLTSHSVPCMFSNMTRKNYHRAEAEAQDNALDMIQRAGVSTLWIENDGGDKNVAKHIPQIKINAQDHTEFCSDQSCLDGAIPSTIKSYLNTQDKKKNQLIVAHFIGSHGPTYFQRYPKAHERFTPACRQSNIENCTDEAISNVYDNTIAYTDFVLAELIKILKKYETTHHVALMYISDHGESLGENGLYLHGTPYFMAPEHQTQVPWFLWLSQSFEKAYNLNRNCLIQLAQEEHVSQDYFFHTLIHFAGVETKAVDPELSLMHRCRNSS